MVIVLNIILILLGLLMVGKPEVAWDIQHAFSVKNGEPTDYYLRMTRVKGIFYIIAAIVIIVVSRL